LPSANSIQMRPWIWILRFVGGAPKPPWRDILFVCVA
jgi:hypothetical protein